MFSLLTSASFWIGFTVAGLGCLLLAVCAVRMSGQPAAPCLETGDLPDVLGGVEPAIDATLHQDCLDVLQVAARCSSVLPASRDMAKKILLESGYVLENQKCKSGRCGPRSLRFVKKPVILSRVG